MAEQLPSTNHEQKTGWEDLITQEGAGEKHEAAHDPAEAAREHAEADHGSAEQLKELQEKAQESAVSKESIKLDESESTNADHNRGLLTISLKASAYDDGLKKIRRQLSGPRKALSKIIHNPSVEMISNATAKTVGRPSGLLSGALCALLGSSLVLYFAKHYGFHYNYAIFLMLLAAGYIAGLCIELVLRLFQRNKA